MKEEELLDARRRLPPRELHQLVLRAMRVSGEPALGLELGRWAPESMLLMLGSVLLSARTLRHAFMLFERYVPLLAEGMTWRLEEEGGQAMFIYQCSSPAGLSTRFAAEYVLAMTLRLATKLMIHIDAVPRRVLFQHDAPEYAARYAATFRCPIEFGREHNAIVCDRKYLDIAQPFADPTLHNLYVAAAERMLLEIDSGSRTLGDRIRQLLQQEIELASVDGPRLAPRLGLTARQLRRKLAKEGLSLTSLVDEGRRTFACEELRHGRSIEDVATRLGFSERSAFHRAFKRWTGETPRAYLHRQGQPSWRALV